MDGFGKKRFLSRGGAPFAGVFVFYFKPTQLSLFQTFNFEITQLSLYSYFFYLDKCFKDNHLQNYFLINILSFKIVRCNKCIAIVFPHTIMQTSSSLVWYRYLIKNPDSFQMPIFGRRKMKIEKLNLLFLFNAFFIPVPKWLSEVYKRARFP